jgi:hypothetical protein
LIDPTSIQVESKNFEHLRLPMPHMTTFHSDFPMDEQLFDYIAMEEGQEQSSLINTIFSSNSTQNPTKSSTEESIGLLLRVLDSIDPPQRRNLQLVPFSPDSIGSYKIEAFPLSLQQCEQWIRSVIIPCGLKALGKFKVDAWLRLCNTDWDKFISKEEIYSLLNRVESLVSLLDERIVSIDHTIREIDLANQAALQVSFGPLYSMASKKLQLCDSKCRDYFLLVGQFLHLLHRRTINARIVSHGYQRWLENIIDQLWESFEDSLDQLIGISTDFRWKVMNLTKRPGSIPIVCNDPLQRQYFSEMLSSKLKVVESLRSRIGVILSLSTVQDHHPTNLIRVAIMASLFPFGKEVEDNDDVDLEYFQLLSDQIMSVSDTMDTTNHLEQNFQRVLAQETAMTHSERLVNYNDTDMRMISGQLKLSWDANMILLEENLENHQKECKYRGVSDLVGSYHTDQKELKDVFQLTNSVTRLYRVKDVIVRSNAVLNEEKREPCTASNLSRAAVDSIVITVKGMLDYSSTIADKRVKSTKVYCNGHSGRRRISCIISEFLYEWLSERFREFHADVTQSELLNTINSQPHSVPIGCENNRSRKQSRKKEKKKSVASSGRADSSGAINNDRIVVNSGNHSDVDDEVDIRPVYINLESTLDEKTQAFDDSTKYAETVGVMDGDNFISARDFLIGRYDEIVSSHQYLVIY